MEKINLSVIIPTRNRAQLLNSTLMSLTKQTLQKSDFEVIVVDNNSNDNTKDVVITYENKLNIKYIFEPKLGLHNGRHAGLRESKSQILVYADDDIEAFPTWLETVYNIFTENENIALVGGKNLPKFESNPPFWLLEKWNKITNDGQIMGELSIIDLGNNERKISPYLVFGCNFSVRKQIVIDAGGFHPDGMPMDLLMYRGDGETHISRYIEEKKLSAYYHPKASVYHFVSNDRMTKDYFCKWHYTCGISAAFADLRKDSPKKFDIKLSFKNIKSFLLNMYAYSMFTDFEKNMKESYKNGYQFLVSHYNLNLEIRDWITKNNYL